ncbi:MAG: mechanosensitive ion channel family protein [Lapillicoccus sp.]
MAESGASGLPVDLVVDLRELLPLQGTVWDRIVGTPLLITVTVVGAVVLRWVIHRVIRRMVATTTARSATRRTVIPGRTGRALADAAGLAHVRHVQRTTTMGAILRSITTFVVFGVALLTVMQLVGLPLGPLLASAGVGGVALGFGAQSLVKDFLSGIFMIVEDQYGVGDVIDTGSATGTVEDVSLRVTRIRDGTGVIWYVRNGEILRIGNRSQGWSTALVDIPVAYSEDISRVTGIINEVIAALDTVAPWDELILEPPVVVGVESMAGGFATIRVTAKCVANEHFGVQREIRERVMRAFDAHHVVVPGPPLMPPAPSLGTTPTTPGVI